MSRKIKVGIITHFYNTINYGGILQAYALCHFLEQERIDSEQICDDLATIVWRVNSVLEFYISRYIGMKKLENERKSFDLYAEMNWLAERMRLYCEFK